MNLRIFSTIASWAICLYLASTGQVPIPLAATLAFLSAALLTPPTRKAAYACPTPFDALRINTEWLPDTVYRKASQTNFWVGYVQAVEFPRNSGVNQTTFVIGNSEPYSNSEAWTDVTLNSNVISTMCQASYQDVNVGYNETTYAPRRIGLAGPVICRETLTFAHQPAQFLRQYQNELVKRAARTWEFDLRNRATQIFAKAIAGTAFDISTGSTVFPGYASNSELTLDMLDEVAQYLIQAGATDADHEWVELGPDGPIFPLVIGLQASQNLTTNQTDRREDYRFADEGHGPQGQLMKALGASRVIRNWRIVPVVLPPRYNFTNGEYVQVNTYEEVSASEGTVARVSADYRNALYEVAFVPHPMAFMKSVIRPDSAGLSWDPLNYMGEWVWETGPLISTTYCFDPMKNYGRHFANFMYAPQPIYPEFGVAIIYKRCLNDAEYAPCTPYYG